MNADGWSYNETETLSGHRSLYGLFLLVKKATGWWKDLVTMSDDQVALPMTLREHVAIPPSFKSLIKRIIEYYNDCTYNGLSRRGFGNAQWLNVLENVAEKYPIKPSKQQATRKWGDRMDSMRTRRVNKAAGLTAATEKKIIDDFGVIFHFIIPYKFLLPLTMRIAFHLMNIAVYKFINNETSIKSDIITDLYIWFSKNQDNKLFKNCGATVLPEHIVSHKQDVIDIRNGFEINNVKRIIYYLSVSAQIFISQVSTLGGLTHSFAHAILDRVWRSGYEINIAQQYLLNGFKITSTKILEKVREYMVNKAAIKYIRANAKGKDPAVKEYLKQQEVHDNSMKLAKQIRDKLRAEESRVFKSGSSSSSAPVYTAAPRPASFVNEDVAMKYTGDFTNIYCKATYTTNAPNYYDIMIALARYFTYSIHGTPLIKINSKSRGGMKNSIKKIRIAKGTQLMKKINFDPYIKDYKKKRYAI